MKTSQSDDFTFIMTCLKHSGERPKPDFAAVAEELGNKDANAAYKRHWSILKKWGLAGNSGKGRKASSGAAATNGTAELPRKRSRPVKSARKTHDEEPEEEDDHESCVKLDPDGKGDEDAGSPKKKIRLDEAEDREKPKDDLV